jgi:hypothetical protein
MPVIQPIRLILSTASMMLLAVCDSVAQERGSQPGHLRDLQVRFPAVH